MSTGNIVVNGRFLSRHVTGVERYGREILRCFGNNYRLEKLALSKVETTRANGLRGHLWEQFILPGKLDAKSILWSPANTGPLMIREQALTIHDLSPLEHPEWFRGSFAAWYRLFLPRLARRVKLIFTPSNYVKEKVERRFGVRNVLVTPGGVDPNMFHPEAKPSQPELPASYVLFVGSLEPRKNLTLLHQAWHQIKNDFKDTWLIIAGAGGPVFRSIALPEIERVGRPGYVAEEDLPGLYAHAKVCVLPSQEEGFGLPALEAMACGTPVIVSDGGALPEVVGEAGLIFKLSEPDALSAALRQTLCDEALRASLKEKGLLRAKMFSWERTAELIWNHLNDRERLDG